MFRSLYHSVMSEQERHNILIGAAGRAPGKRQIKPSAALFYGHLIGGEEDEEDDAPFTLPAETPDSEAESSSEFGTNDGKDDKEEGEGSENNENGVEGSKSGYESDTDDEAEDEMLENGRESGGRSGDGSDDEDLVILNDQPSTSHKVPATKECKRNRLNGWLLTENGHKQLKIPKIVLDDGAEPSLDHQKLCAICLNLRTSEQFGEIIQCDRCALAVHEGCYGAIDDGNHPQNHQGTIEAETQSTDSSASTEPWFCEPCLYNSADIPHCELCPNRYGAFKRTDVGGGWIHLVCALFTPGISFADVDHLSAVSCQEIDSRNFGRKPCSGCADRLEARTGVTVRCDAGLCKNYYHVTCAQRLGLIIDLESNDHRHQRTHHHWAKDRANEANHHSEAGFLYCKRHVPKDASVLRQRNAYAQFVAQEERRMIHWNRVRLDSRQEKKRQIQLHQYELRLKNFQGTIITMPTQKYVKMLQTSAQYLNAFAEKHELLGLTRSQFAEEFAAVPAAQLPPNLPCAFSKTFFSYVEHRDRVGMADEEARLEQLGIEWKQRHKDQKDAERRLGELRNVQNDTQREHDIQQHHLERFRAFLSKILPHSSIVSKTPPPEHSHSPLKKKRSSKPVEAVSSSKKNITIAENSEASFNKSASSIQVSHQEKAKTFLIDENHKLPVPQKMMPLSIECHKCKKTTDPHLFVYCDTCKRHCHIGCLDPPLVKMPTKNKFTRFECSDCACPSGEEKETEETGAEKKDKSATEILLQENWALLEHRPKRQRRTRKSSLMSTA